MLARQRRAQSRCHLEMILVKADLVKSCHCCQCVIASSERVTPISGQRNRSALFPPLRKRLIDNIHGEHKHIREKEEMITLKYELRINLY